MAVDRVLTNDGVDSAVVLSTVVASHPEIERIEFREYARDPSIEGRAELSADELRVVEQGRQLRKETSLPFWDSVLLSCFSSPRVPKGVLAAASYHSPGQKPPVILERSEVSEESIRKIAESIKKGTMILVSSRVWCQDSTVRHIPMLDFRCPESPHNHELVKAVVLQLGLQGFVLRSGYSYHFYGKLLMNDQQMTRFLARALLFSPIVDRVWIAHQLLESNCGLRISSREPGGEMPSLVFRVDQE